MHKQLVILSAITALALQAHAKTNEALGWGPRFSLGRDYVAGSTVSSWIRESNTTLVLPAVLAPDVDDVALWPGMETSSGDLIQAICTSNIGSFLNSNGVLTIHDNDCGAEPNQWCVMAGVLKDAQRCSAIARQGLTEESCHMTYGPTVPANEGDHISIHYKYNDSTGEYDQAVSINGDVVSTLSTDSGHAINWQTQAECHAGGCSSTLKQHRYLDTVIQLDSADPNYADTTFLRNMKNPGFESSDGGLTWPIKKIKMAAIEHFDVE